MTNLLNRILSEKYRVDELIGRGGMAEVYKVWDMRRSVFLAMKVLTPDLSEDKIFLRHFEREAKTLEDLQHPHIVRYFGLEQDGPLSFMLMDYIDGKTLRTEIFETQEPLSPERVIQIMHPVCAALNFAHSMNRVHCDIKPANIMLQSNGNILVADFGIARMIEGSTTTSLRGAGTPAYMAPEQIMGFKPQPQTDIYALGIVLYEMLTGGERPFTGQTAPISGTTAERVRWEHQNVPPPSLREHNPLIHSELEKVVLRCLEKEPEKRFASTIELLSSLEHAARGMPITETQTGQTVYPTLLPDNTSAPTKSEKIAGISPLLPIKDTQEKQGNNWKIILPVILFLCLIGASTIAAAAWGVNALRQANDPTATPTRSMAAEPSLTPRPSSTITPTKEIPVVASTTPTTIENTSTPTTTPTSPPPTRTPTPVLVIPDNLWVTYYSDINGNRDIFLLNPSSGTNSWIVTDPSHDKVGTWSPDGRYMAFESNRSSTIYYQIYLLDYESKTITRLTDLTECSNWAPAWSPDGKKIVHYSDCEEGKRNIYIMNRDGSNRKKLTSSSGENKFPAFSPDGNLITFTSTRNGGNQIMLMNPDGSGQRVITDGCSSTFSADGNWLWFSATCEDSEIRRIQVDGMKLSQFSAVLGQNPVESPDGQFVVFQSNDDIWMMSVDGTNLKQLTSGSSLEGAPSWQP